MAQEERVRKLQVDPDLARRMTFVPDIRLSPRHPADSIRDPAIDGSKAKGNWGNDNYQRIWISFVGPDSVVPRTIYQATYDGVAYFSGGDSGVDLVFGTGLNAAEPREYLVRLTVVSSTGKLQVLPEPPHESYCSVLSPDDHEWQVSGGTVVVARVARSYYGKRCSFRLRGSSLSYWRLHSAELALR